MSTSSEPTTDTTSAPPDTTGPAQAPAQPLPAGPPTGAATEPTEPTEPDGDHGREAAKYRRQLRVAEQERDGLAEQVGAAQRALIGYLAEGTGIHPAALWANGATLADLLDEAGHVDPELVKAACEAAAADLGLARRPRPDLSQGNASPPAAATWADAFKHA